MVIHGNWYFLDIIILHSNNKALYRMTVICVASKKVDVYVHVITTTITSSHIFFSLSPSYVCQATFIYEAMQYRVSQSHHNLLVLQPLYSNAIHYLSVFVKLKWLHKGQGLQKCFPKRQTNSSTQNIYETQQIYCK